MATVIESIQSLSGQLGLDSSEVLDHVQLMMRKRIRDRMEYNREKAEETPRKPLVPSVLVIKTYLYQRDMRMKDLAVKINCCQPTLSAVVHGKVRSPKIENAISVEMGVPVERIFPVRAAAKRQNKKETP